MNYIIKEILFKFILRWIVLPQIYICSVNIELIAKGSCVLLCWNTQYTCIPEDCTYNQHWTCHFLWRQRMMFLPHSSSHFGQKITAYWSSSKWWTHPWIHFLYRNKSCYFYLFFFFWWHSRLIKFRLFMTACLRFTE